MLSRLAGGVCAAAAARRLRARGPAFRGLVSVPSVGHVFSETRAFSQEEVSTFAELCGDDNPIHQDSEIARQSIFGGPIVHGIFTASIFSCILGSRLTGSVYVSQDLSFRAPLHVGTTFTGNITVQEVLRKSKGFFLNCQTECVLEDGTRIIDGKATVFLPNDAIVDPDAE